MRRKRVRMLTLTLAALAACTRGGSEEPRPRAELVGAWELVTVNDAALPAPSPEERAITLESVIMTLEANGAYSVASSYRVTGQTHAQGATIGGRWVADDDALTFENDSSEGPALVMFGYRLDGGLLRLVDEQQNAWVLRRR